MYWMLRSVSTCRTVDFQICFTCGESFARMVQWGDSWGGSLCPLQTICSSEYISRGRWKWYVDSLLSTDLVPVGRCSHEDSKWWCSLELCWSAIDVCVPFVVLHSCIHIVVLSVPAIYKLCIGHVTLCWLTHEKSDSIWSCHYRNHLSRYVTL